MILEENGGAKSRSSNTSSLGVASGLVDDTAKTNDESADVDRTTGTPSGVVQSGNDVSNLDMRDGVKFDVRFEDSLVHSVKVVAYARA